MPVYPLATPPSRVVRMEEADERLLAVKGAIHDFVSSSGTSGKKGTGAGRGCEPRPAPRNQLSSREGSGLGGLLTSSPMLTTARASMAVSSGSGAAVATTPEGAAPPHLHPQRTWIYPPMLRSTSYLQTAHRMKCWAPRGTDQQNHPGTGWDVCCVRSKRPVGTYPAERLLLSPSDLPELAERPARVVAEGANPFIKERRDRNEIMLIRPQQAHESSTNVSSAC